MKLILGLIVTAWLVVGLVATGQRGYFGNDQVVNCKKGADLAVTIVVGPLNYLGVNPKVSCPGSLRPSG